LCSFVTAHDKDGLCRFISIRHNCRSSWIFILAPTFKDCVVDRLDCADLTITDRFAGVDSQSGGVLALDTAEFRTLGYRLERQDALDHHTLGLFFVEIIYFNIR
jgi:hypothetical protein